MEQSEAEVSRELMMYFHLQRVILVKVLSYSVDHCLSSGGRWSRLRHSLDRKGTHSPCTGFIGPDANQITHWQQLQGLWKTAARQYARSGHGMNIPPCPPAP